jgi:hypothetical protein
MKKLRVLFSLGLFVLYQTSCTKPVNLCSDESTPKPISNPQVQNLPGAAKISYTLPDNPNLLYVKAVWEYKGVSHEAKSSLYDNSVLLEGFNDTLQHEVKLYAVSNCEKPSDAVTANVQPQRAPIWGVYYSLVVVPTWGGINISYQNPTGANIIVGVVVKDSLGAWQHVDFNYSKQTSNNFNIRGFTQNPTPPLKYYVFGVYVKDRWDNRTDTLVPNSNGSPPGLAPWYEELVDKSKFRDVRPNNYPVPQVPPLPISGGPIVNAVDYSSSYPMTKLWDGNSTKSSMFHTKQNVDQPVWIPFDLDQTGVTKYKLSRFKIWQRSEGSYPFNHGNPHKWEIWGTNNPSSAANWVKLGSYEMIKPSGYAVGINSDEDNQVAINGQEYDFPLNVPAVRYLAIKSVDCWASIGGTYGFFHLYELSLWGQKQ